MILYISNYISVIFFSFTISLNFLLELFESSKLIILLFYNNLFSIGIHGLPHLSSCLFHRKYLLTTKKSKRWAEILSYSFFIYS